jgi:hypothetical protein
MQDTRALLELIYKNAEMGRLNLPELIKLSSDAKFTASLKEQLSDYEALSNEATRMIRELYGEDPNGVNLLDKMRTEITLRISTFRDTSVPHIADMLVKGNSMGITDMAKQLKTYRMASEEARGLAERLLKSQERNLDNMKGFLTLV